MDIEVDQSIQNEEKISKKREEYSIEDLKLEYKLKYEGLLKIYHEMVKAFAEATQSSEVLQDGYHSYLNGLMKAGLEKDMQIYNLQEEVTELKSKSAELQSKYSKLEEQTTKMDAAQNGHVANETVESQNQASSLNKADNGHVASGTLESQNQSCSIQKSDNDVSIFKEKARVLVDESPIVVTSIPTTDIASPFFLPETPRQVSRMRRMSIMNETIDKATPTDAGEKGTFFKRIIMEQKELLDFYATMTGFMAWKERMQNDHESQECLVDFFKMKSQNSKLKDLEIQFVVDYAEDDIEYRPISLPPEAEDSLQKLAPYLRDTLYLSSENAPKLLKTLLDASED